VPRNSFTVARSTPFHYKVRGKGVSEVMESDALILAFVTNRSNVLCVCVDHPS
jgi:hypothetical protein